MNFQPILMGQAMGLAIPLRPQSMETMLEWRHMQERDLARVLDIANQVHPGFPEDPCVFLERLQLFPKGCHVLVDGRDLPCAYGLSHPWLWENVPALNSLLGTLPPVPTCYYFHDMAMLPSARGQGYAQSGIQRIQNAARDASQSRIAGVAVNNSYGFWLKQGFHEHEVPALRAKLHSYEVAAKYMVLELGL